MSYSHIYFVGCSYMHSYVKTQPFDDWNLQFPNAELINLTQDGSSFDTHYRLILENIIKTKPKKALVILGLTGSSRFELGQNNFNTEELSYHNILPMMSAEHLPTVNIKEYVNAKMKHFAMNKMFYINQTLMNIITLSGWLKNLNHDYLFFNFCESDYQIINKTNIHLHDYIKTDHKINDLSMLVNLFLFEQGVMIAQNDIALNIPTRHCHPNILDPNYKKIMTTFLLENVLRNNNENFNS